MTIQEMMEKLWGKYEYASINVITGGLMLEVSDYPITQGKEQKVSCFKDGLTMQERLADCIGKLKKEGKE